MACRRLLVVCALLLGSWAEDDSPPWKNDNARTDYPEQRHDGFWVADPMQLTIANPLHGTFFCEKFDPVPVHVLFSQNVIPEGGHALITIDQRVISAMQPLPKVLPLHFHSGPALSPSQKTLVVPRSSPSC